MLLSPKRPDRMCGPVQYILEVKMSEREGYQPPLALKLIMELYRNLLHIILMLVQGQLGLHFHLSVNLDRIPQNFSVYSKCDAQRRVVSPHSNIS